MLAAPDLRHAFLPAIVSTSGRIHGELLRLLFIFADKKTTLSCRAMGEAADVDSEAYCWRRSGFSGACGLPLGWRARKPLPCAPRSSADLAPVKLFR